MTGVVGQQVARYRRQRGRSAQQVAQRCAELGFPSLSRAVITKLENGHRETISAAEVVVLATALEVAPLELIYPIGLEKEIEIIPGRNVSSLDAVQWFCGQLELSAPEAVAALRVPASGKESGIYLLQYHESLIERFREQEDLAAKAAADAAAQDATQDARNMANFRAAAAEEWRNFIKNPLRKTRAEMGRRGMLLPPLPPDLDLGEVAENLTEAVADDEPR
jgi:transcriptional regulator with XRE-family HTH domain